VASRLERLPVEPTPAKALGKLDVDLSPAARRELGELGRTEDVRFSPSGTRLAIAGFLKNEIAVADVEITEGPTVAVTAVIRVRSPALQLPHGLDWIDEESIVVGNRDGAVVELRTPPSGAAERAFAVEALAASGQAAADGPGSVLVRTDRAGELELLRCNNWADTVTRHSFAEGAASGVGEIVATRSLDLPDGISVSRDGRWLAVSSHNSHAVLVYDYAGSAADAAPVAALRGVRFPHGLRFARGDQWLYVADAGAPFVHAFATRGGEWAGVRYPDRTLRVMSEETFARGRESPEEGGPKGVDVHPRVNVLAVTAEQLPLAFFSLDDLTRADAPGDELLLEAELDVLDHSRVVRGELRSQLAQSRAQIDEYGQLHAELTARYADIGRLEADSGRLQAQVAGAESELARLELDVAGLKRGLLELRDEYERSRSWRLTRPLRALSGVARRSRRGAPPS
jgi:hypothetical protein